MGPLLVGVLVALYALSGVLPDPIFYTLLAAVALLGARELHGRRPPFNNQQTSLRRSTP